MQVNAWARRASTERYCPSRRPRSESVGRPAEARAERLGLDRKILAEGDHLDLEVRDPIAVTVCHLPQLLGWVGEVMVWTFRIRAESDHADLEVGGADRVDELNLGPTS